MQKILFVGGTKYIGKEVVGELLLNNHNIHILSRGNQKPPWWSKITHHKGDRNNLDSIKSLKSRRFDVIIDTQAFHKDHVQSLYQYFQYDIGHYILLSSTSAYNFGTPLFDSDYQLKEDDIDYRNPIHLKNGSRYAIGKRECEKYVIECRDVSFTIFRPPKIFGPSDPSLRFWWWIQRIIDGRGIIIPDRYTNNFQFVFSDDLVNCITKSIHSENSRNKIFNVANDEKFNIKSWIEILSKSTNTTPKFTFVPNSILKQKSELENYNTPLYSYSPYLFDTSEIKKHLRITFTPAEDWISAAVYWHRNEYQGADSEGYEYRSIEAEIYNKINEDF